MQTLGVLMLSEQFALSRAHEAFGEDGSLKQARQQAAIAALAQRLVEVGIKLGA